MASRLHIFKNSTPKGRVDVPALGGHSHQLRVEVKGIAVEQGLLHQVVGVR